MHEPKSFQQDVSHLSWQESMLKEFTALETNHTWGIFPLSSNKKYIIANEFTK